MKKTPLVDQPSGWSGLLLLVLPIAAGLLLCVAAWGRNARATAQDAAPTAPPTVESPDDDGKLVEPPGLSVAPDAEQPKAAVPLDAGKPNAPEPTTAEPKANEAGQGDAAQLAHLGGLIASLTVFGLAGFLGFEIITKVPPTLHTPLMSGSNAISGITLVGALLVAGSGSGVAPWLGMAAAVALATINVVGGFLVTHRMLAMFQARK